MLHTNFRGNRSNGSGEEDFLRGFNIYGHGRHLGHVTSIMSLNFIFLVLHRNIHLTLTLKSLCMNKSKEMTKYQSIITIKPSRPRMAGLR